MESPTRRQPDIPHWQAVSCPRTVRFFRIGKELHTHGRLYGIYHDKDRDVVWLGQSVYGMAVGINKLRRYPKVHSSTAYRILRGEAERRHLRGITVERLVDVDHGNELLDRIDASSVVVVTRNPEKWELKAPYKAKVE
jgi:hypothetical protein